MSQIALQSNAGGTGIFTVASPNSNTNRTLTIPDETGTFITSASIAASLNATGSAPIYAARAWVNFNGTGTAAIRAAGNVTSITDNGVGLYTLNFTTALPDTNYSAQVIPDDSGTVNPCTGGGYTGSTRTTSAYQIQTVLRGASSAVLFDSPQVSVSVFR